MNGGGIARRYVEPLFEVALEKNLVDRIAEELSLFDDTLQKYPEFRKFLFNPSLNRKTKKAVLEELFSQASIYTLNFMRVVIDKNRPEVLTATYRLFNEMLNRQRGVAPGVIETATPLDDDTFNKVKMKLEARFSCKLDLERKVDPMLLGGILVRVGNNVIDGSLRGQLSRLKLSLTTG